jgi:hypothetical protein
LASKRITVAGATNAANLDNARKAWRRPSSAAFGSAFAESVRFGEGRLLGTGSIPRIARVTSQLAPDLPEGRRGMQGHARLLMVSDSRSTRHLIGLKSIA